MTDRRKKITLIQITIFLVAIYLIYNTYRDKKETAKEMVTIEAESINMKEVEANFYFKDDTILKVTSDEGFYNNLTLDMKFIKNVKSKYLTNTVLSDSLDYSNSNSKLLASGNVRGESVEKGEFIADNVEYDLSKNTLDFSMFGSKQVNVKLKN